MELDLPRVRTLAALRIPWLSVDVEEPVLALRLRKLENERRGLVQRVSRGESCHTAMFGMQEFFCTVQEIVG